MPSASVIKKMRKHLPKIYGVYFNVLVLLSQEKTAKKAFELFAAVRKGRVSEHQKQYLDPAKKNLLLIAEHTIQTYQWPGLGETVLLVHGWESNSFRWRNLIAKLRAADFNIIAFDAPGHGNSSGQRLHVPLYANVLRHIITQYRPKYVVAHSIGGMALLYQEYLAPSSSVKKMVTVASPSELFEIVNHFQRLLNFNDKVMQALKTYIQKQLKFDIETFSSTDFVSDNTKKGLLFHDKLDKVTPYHASQKVHASWKDSRLISTEGLGHSMHQDEVNDTIVGFFRD